MMKLQSEKIWKIVRDSFKKEYGYPINEHISYDLVKFLIGRIVKDTK